MIRQIAAEGLGTALLLIGVVGSGIMAQRLTDDIAVALLCNAVATGATLYYIITIFGPISGAHFNPVVTLACALRGDIAWPVAFGFIPIQMIGAVLGVWVSHAMFNIDIIQFSTTARSGIDQWFAEVVATFGLLLVIFGGLRAKPEAVASLVALYITGAYFFTASTSFANPAVTFARMFTETFAGIDPAHVFGFILAQLIGLAVATPILAWLFSQNVN